MSKPIMKNMVLLRLLAEWLLYKQISNSCYKAAMKLKNYSTSFFFHKTPPTFNKSPNKYPNLPKHSTFNPKNNNSQKTFVCDVEGALLRTRSLFPFFMLVAFEGGSIVRAFLLLLSCPVIWLLGSELRLRAMIFITFCGMRLKDVEMVSRAVLPKFYLENLDLHTYEAMASCGTKMVFTSVPRVMVEWFLKEYLSVGVVRGTELHVVGDCFFSGLVSSSGVVVKHRALKEFFGDNNKCRPHVGFGTSGFRDLLFISQCEEAYVVNREDMTNNKINGSSTSSIMPREKYPKPLVFHDGRLAFLPTPLASLAMFIWLPIGIPLAIIRISVGILLPYKVATFLASYLSVNARLIGSVPARSQKDRGVLYVCTHRTLLDPVFLSTLLNKPLTAVTYSLSRFSEMIAPIKTVRLTRDRSQDGQTIQRLLSLGDLVVCPEGTTCREPYLLRFSSLFAELADEIVPVAIDTCVGMFYGTTASGLKWLDPFFFMMNPRPIYRIHILGKLPKELTCAGGKSSHDVANYIQRQLADALGFECTNLTRRDKYLMLAGNEGIVKNHKKD